jgi:hypothetical protein
MLVLLDDPALVDDLCAHFRRSGFTADPAGGSMVEVDRPDAPSAEQARNEVEMHLRIWEVIYPGRGAATVSV